MIHHGRYLSYGCSCFCCCCCYLSPLCCCCCCCCCCCRCCRCCCCRSSCVQRVFWLLLLFSSSYAIYQHMLSSRTLLRSLAILVQPRGLSEATSHLWRFQVFRVRRPSELLALLRIKTFSVADLKKTASKLQYFLRAHLRTPVALRRGQLRGREEATGWFNGWGC